MKTIAAQLGWSIVTHDPKNKTLHKEPVLAWHMLKTGVRGKLYVLPVVVSGSISTPDIIFERPDNSFVQPSLDEWWDDEEGLLMRFEETAEFEEEPDE